MLLVLVGTSFDWVKMKSEKWVAVHVNSYGEVYRVVGIFESQDDTRSYINEEHYYSSDEWFAVRIERSEAEKWA